MVGRGDAEDVRAAGRSDEVVTALVRDADREPGVARLLPGGVDAGALVDDGDGAVGDGVNVVISTRFVISRYVVAPTLTPPASLTSDAARRAPSAIWWAIDAERSRGTSTTIANCLFAVGLEFEQAAAQTNVPRTATVQVRGRMAAGCYSPR